MEIYISDAEIRHLSQMEKIEKLCFSLPWTYDQLKTCLKDAQHECIVALNSDDMVFGYVGMMCVLDEGYIGNIAVHPEYRRLGIADRLMKQLKTVAESRGLQFISLEVRAGNEPAIMLYQKHGFVSCGRRSNYYSFPKEDAVIMTKLLKTEA